MTHDHHPVHEAGMAMMTTMRAMLEFMSDQVDLSPQQLMTVQCVKMAEEHGTRVSDVADVLGCSASAASRTVDALVEQDLLSRTADQQDRRVQRLRLSPDGRKISERADIIAGSILNQATQGIEAERLEHVAETMREVAERTIKAIATQNSGGRPSQRLHPKSS